MQPGRQGRIPMTDSRPTWVDCFLGIADAVAVRADCTRRKVGAVVVDRKTKHIISTGYNGAAPGEPGCLSAGACPRGRHYELVPSAYAHNAGLHGCAWGDSLACSAAATPGGSYDTGVHSCIAIHAEANALLRAGQQARGNWLFCTDKPCDGCMRLIKGAGIHMVVWYGGVWYYNGGFKKELPVERKVKKHKFTFWR